MRQYYKKLGFTEASSTNLPKVAYQKTATLWALRILVKLGGYKHFHHAVVDEDNLLAALGLKSDPEGEDRSAAELKRIFEVRLAEIERNRPTELGTLQHNLRLLAKALEMNAIDCKVLAFAAIVHNVPWLESASDTLGMLDAHATITVLAKVLELPHDAVRRALDPQSVLGATHILRLRSETADLKTKTEPARRVCRYSSPEAPKRNGASETIFPIFAGAKTIGRRLSACTKCLDPDSKLPGYRF